MKSQQIVVVLSDWICFQIRRQNLKYICVCIKTSAKVHVIFIPLLCAFLKSLSGNAKKEKKRQGEFIYEAPLNHNKKGFFHKIH